MRGGQLAYFAVNILLEIVMHDVKSLLETLFEKKTWPTDGTVPCEKVVKTVEDYCDDFKHVHRRHMCVLLARLQHDILSVYRDALFRKNAYLGPQGRRKIAAELELLNNSFDSLHQRFSYRTPSGGGGGGDGDGDESVLSQPMRELKQMKEWFKMLLDILDSSGDSLLSALHKMLNDFPSMTITKAEALLKLYETVTSNRTTDTLKALKSMLEQRPGGGGTL